MAGHPAPPLASRPRPWMRCPDRPLDFRGRLRRGAPVPVPLRGGELDVPGRRGGGGLPRRPRLAGPCGGVLEGVPRTGAPRPGRRSAAACRARRGNAGPVAPPPDLPGEGSSLFRRGDGPGALRLLAGLLRCVSRASGQEGAARIAPEDAARRRAPAGTLLPGDANGGGARDGPPLLRGTPPEESPCERGVHGRGDGGLFPRGRGGVPRLREPAPGVPLDAGGGRRLGVPVPHRRLPAPLQLRVRPGAPRGQPRDRPDRTVHRAGGRRRVRGVRLSPGVGTVQVRPRRSGPDRLPPHGLPVTGHLLVSYHTCPVEEPGEGLAGGMNVFLRGLLRGLSKRGVGTDVLTRATGETVEVEAPFPGVRIFHVPCGWVEPPSRESAFASLDLFVERCRILMRGERIAPRVVSAHYWMSGVAARNLVDAPMVLSYHTVEARMVPLEALGSGVPVVVPAGTYWGERVRTEGGGLVYGPGEPEGLPGALLSLASSPALRARLSLQGPAVSAPFTWEKCTSSWEALLSSVSRPRSPR